MTEAEPITAVFADYDPKPRSDGKYRFSIALDLAYAALADVLAILTSSEAQALEEAEFEFEYDQRNGYGYLCGWRLPTEGELAKLQLRRAESRDWKTEHDRHELERIRKAHPDWLK
jgi:hypothetical protein